MTIGKLSASLVFIAFLSGCAAKPSRVSDLPPLPDSQVKLAAPADESALILVEPRKLKTRIKNNAEGFSGSSCMISFNLYPYLYLKLHERLGKTLTRIDVSTSMAGQENYDYVVKASIDEVVWYSVGMSGDNAAVKVKLDVLKGGAVYASYEAFQEGEGRLNKVMGGCHDAATATSIASTNAVNYGLNTILVAFDRREKTAKPAGGIGARPSEGTAAALQKVAALNDKIALVTSDTPDMHEPEDYAGMDCEALAKERAIVLANQKDAESGGDGLGALGMMGYALQGAAMGTGNMASAMQMQSVNSHLENIRDESGADVMAFGARLDLLDQVGAVRKCKR